jgi:glycosyltransferase involved in cell wall biosynthesis
MLAGLPVVASDVSSLPELVVNGETGYLVRPNDPSALARSVVQALETPSLGAAGRERARQAFSVDRMAAKTAELYARLCE